MNNKYNLIWIGTGGDEILLITSQAHDKKSDPTKTKENVTPWKQVMGIA